MLCLLGFSPILDPSLHFVFSSSPTKAATRSFRFRVDRSWVLGSWASGLGSHSLSLQSCDSGLECRVSDSLACASRLVSWVSSLQSWVSCSSFQAFRSFVLCLGISRSSVLGFVYSGLGSWVTQLGSQILRFRSQVSVLVSPVLLSKLGVSDLRCQQSMINVGRPGSRAGRAGCVDRG